MRAGNLISSQYKCCFEEVSTVIPVLFEFSGSSFIAVCFQMDADRLKPPDKGALKNEQGGFSRGHEISNKTGISLRAGLFDRFKRSDFAVRTEPEPEKLNQYISAKKEVKGLFSP